MYKNETERTMWVHEPHALYHAEGARWKRTHTAASQAHVATVSVRRVAPLGEGVLWWVGPLWVTWRAGYTAVHL